MNASALPAPTPSTPDDGVLVHDGIALLLDLMEPEPAPSVTTGAGAALAARAQDWSMRAASWGAGPQGSRRAW